MNSCAVREEIEYFQNAENFTNSTIQFAEPHIQINDILKVQVGAANPEAAKPFNKPTANFGNTNIEVLKLQGYLVNNDYSITLPVIGKINVKEKTSIMLENELTDILVKRGLLTSPTVDVRIVNAKFTILGNISRPGTYTFTESAITIMQAIGMAGDLNINGQRNDILVLREEDGVRKLGKLDLRSVDMLNSPYYYIKQNDYIYIKPNGPAVKRAGYLGNLGTVLSAISATLTIILVFRRF